MSEMSKVTGRKNILHRLAECVDCDWQAADYRDRNMPAKCKRHVEQTGHTVVYETGTSTRYRRAGHDTISNR